MTSPKPVSQQSLLIEYFKKNPNRDIKHPEVVDWVEKEYFKKTGKKFRDPDRGIRKLHQNGLLIKVGDGVYKYDPALAVSRTLEDFSSQTKKQIFKRDGYKCVVCGNGPKEGFPLYADHIKAKDKGGLATLENGQTLCGPHNFFKKNYSQTEMGKRMFILFYKQAKKLNDTKMQKFYSQVLELFEKNNIDTHIKWNR